MHWQIVKQDIIFDRTLVMAILNVTPDSFSDGGNFASTEPAVERAKRVIVEGADIIDIGGESTRPGSKQISVEEEIARVVPVIEAIRKTSDIPISIDTSKSGVAQAAIDAGADIVNDISGLRFDPELARVAAETGAGIVLMHSRGSFEEMHALPPVDDIMAEVENCLATSIDIALKAGVAKEQIALDIGIGFGKSLDQNLELLANLDKIIEKFSGFPMLVGTSRKSFLGKILDIAEPTERLNGSLASAVIAVWNGTNIIRAHDVRETVEAVKIANAARKSVDSSLTVAFCPK